jgi:hypothetical protein
MALIFDRQHGDHATDLNNSDYKYFAHCKYVLLITQVLRVDLMV